MTKDGFMFLVMGFTGKKAAQIKEAYINAFNQMSTKLSSELSGGGDDDDELQKYAMVNTMVRTLKLKGDPVLVPRLEIINLVNDAQHAQTTINQLQVKIGRLVENANRLKVMVPSSSLYD